MSKEIFEKLLARMFPGNEELGLPVFSGPILENTDWIEDDIVEQVCELVNLCSSQVISDDVNELLKRMRRENNKLVNRFIINAVETYFSSSQVVSALRGGNAVLFPHVQSLPDINFDLLVPVMELHGSEAAYE